MKRRTFLMAGSAVAGAGVWATASGAGQSSDSSESLPSSDSSTGAEDGDDGERDIEELEAIARENPEELTESEATRVLLEHEGHAACPICTGLSL